MSLQFYQNANPASCLHTRALLTCIMHRVRANMCTDPGSQLGWSSSLQASRRTISIDLLTRQVSWLDTSARPPYYEGGVETTSLRTMLLSSMPATFDSTLQNTLASRGAGNGLGVPIQGPAPSNAQLPMVDESLLFFGRMDTFSGQEPEFTEVFRMSVAGNVVSDVCRSPSLRLTGSSNCFVVSRAENAALPSRRDLYGAIPMSYTFYGKRLS